MESSPPLVAAARAAGVRDRRVLDALVAVRRSAYVPPEHRDAADRDGPIPIGWGQVTTQPSLVAAMVEALALRGDERVLEVGAGLGYEAALLGALARDVWTVERRPELAVAASSNLVGQGVENVRVVVRDGTEGVPEHAPYDAIVIAAAHPRVPPPLVLQLAPGGRLVQPIGPSGAEDVTLFGRDPRGQLVRRRTITHAHFVALYGRHGYPG